jgi:hypothetical protein
MPTGIFGVPSHIFQIQQIRTGKRSQNNWLVHITPTQFANQPTRAAGNVCVNGVLNMCPSGSFHHEGDPATKMTDSR